MNANVINNLLYNRDNMIIFILNENENEIFLKLKFISLNFIDAYIHVPGFHIDLFENIIKKAIFNLKN